MLEQGKHPNHIHSIDLPVVNASLPTIPTSTLLTVSPEGIKQSGVLSPRDFAALLHKQATRHHTKQIRLADPMALRQVSALADEMAKLSDSVHLSVMVGPRDTGGHPLKAPSALSGIKLAEWVDPEGHIPSFTPVLTAFSNAGIWNHLRFSAEKDHHLVQPFMRFAVTNPNIVHSWEIMAPGHSYLNGQTNAADTAISAYSRYSPLPGRPFWQCLPDTAHLLLYLSQYGLQTVKSWWIPAAAEALITLGGGLSYHFVAPQALSPERLDEICSMVEAGGSVRTKYVRHNLERAFLIAYVTEMDVVVANSSLKHPRPQFIARLKKQTGVDFSGYLERGYTSVRPEYRGMGLATRLLDGLTSRAGDRKLFSLIGEDNIAAQKIALRNRTRKVSTFISQRTGKLTGIWLPETTMGGMQGPAL